MQMTFGFMYTHNAILGNESFIWCHMTLDDVGFRQIILKTEKNEGSN